MTEKLERNLPFDRLARVETWNDYPESRGIERAFSKNFNFEALKIGSVKRHFVSFARRPTVVSEKWR